MSRQYWEKVGEVGVDAGIVWLGDPCYILHEQPKEIGEDWDEFCDILAKKEKEKGDGWQASQFNYDLGHAGLGVVVPSGYGDGCYPVKVKRNAEGRIMQVMIDFR